MLVHFTWLKAFRSRTFFWFSSFISSFTFLLDSMSIFSSVSVTLDQRLTESIVSADIQIAINLLCFSYSRWTLLMDASVKMFDQLSEKSVRHFLRLTSSFLTHYSAGWSDSGTYSLFYPIVVVFLSLNFAFYVKEFSVFNQGTRSTWQNGSRWTDCVHHSYHDKLSLVKQPVTCIRSSEWSLFLERQIITEVSRYNETQNSMSVYVETATVLVHKQP